MRAIVFCAEGNAVAPPLHRAFRAGAWQAVPAASEQELLARAGAGTENLIVIQSASPDGKTLALACRLRASAAGRVRLLLVAGSRADDLVLAAMRAGYNDVLLAGCSESDAAEALARVHQPAPRPARPLQGGDRLIGGSRALGELRQAIQRVAASDCNVLITGETGTGKELTAELIHGSSRRCDRPFVSLNCAAIPDGLLESELFGYERGAFTGAHAAREGKLQYAQGGTLFLDEVGDMNLYAQAKILRAIESRKVQRLGGHRDIAVNIRIVAATNHPLEQLTSQQKFRQDLYFRLNVARIVLPPLRDRLEDVPALVAHLLAELTSPLDRRPPAVDRSFLDPLAAYDWPGNVRELRNVIESALVFCTGDRIMAHDLPVQLRAHRAGAARARDGERETIVAALHATAWNRSEAARRLGCSRMTLYRKMVKYDLLAADALADEPCPLPAGA